MLLSSRWSIPDVAQADVRLLARLASATGEAAWSGRGAGDGGSQPVRHEAFFLLVVVAEGAGDGGFVFIVWVVVVGIGVGEGVQSEVGVAGARGRRERAEVARRIGGSLED